MSSSQSSRTQHPSFDGPKWLKGEAAQTAMNVFIGALLRDEDEIRSDLSPKREHALRALEALKSSGETSALNAIESWQAAIHVKDTRKAQGAFYTSQDDALSLAMDMAKVLVAVPERILEPTCGGGSLVVAILEVFPKHFGLETLAIASRILAMDLDPIGVELARWAVADRFGDAVANAIDFRIGDALRAEIDVAIDCVIANPPFGNAIEKKTSRGSAELRDLKKRFPLSTTGAFDRCSLFVERIHQLVPADAVLGWILPTSFLAHPSAERLRAAIGSERRLASIRALSSAAFIGANVGTSSLVIGPKRDSLSGDFSLNGESKRVSLKQLSAGEWSALLHPLTGAFDEISAAMCALGDHVSINAGATTDEAYRWKDAIAERASVVDIATETWFPLIIAGTIEPFSTLWGKEPTRYLGERFDEPMIRLSALNDRRQATAKTPRVLIAGLSRATEAWLDAKGESVGAVSTLSVIPHAAFPLPILCAILNSAWLRVEYASAFGALALSGGNIQVTRQKLAAVPTPILWWAPPAGLVARHHPFVEEHLAHVNLELGKALPSTTAIDGILQMSRTLSESDVSTQALWEHLYWLCERHALDSNRLGWLDILLVAIARRPAS